MISNFSMGNQINILDKNGEQIGTASHSLACLAYVTDLAQRYNPDFNLVKAHYAKNLNKHLDETFEEADPEDKLVSLIFMNDKLDLTEEEIPLLEKAIKKYPSEFREGPRTLLLAYKQLLEEHKSIRLEYTGHVTAAFTVSRA